MGQATPTQDQNMGDNDFDVVEADAGASATVSVEAGSIRKGGYIMIKGFPCKVKDVSTSKTGKHGHAKCKFQASDIFTGATKEELCPSSHSIDVPVVNKKDWTVTGIDEDGFVQLMDDDGEMREDLKCPVDMGFDTDDDGKATENLKAYVAEVNEGAEIDIFCTVISAVGKEKILEPRKKEAS